MARKGKSIFKSTGSKGTESIWRIPGTRKTSKVKRGK